MWKRATLAAVLALAMLAPGAQADVFTVSPMGGGGGGGGTGCTPTGGSTTNLVLYGAGGLCSPATAANVVGGALTLGTASAAQGSITLEGSSSGAAALTGGSTGVFTSSSPWALSGNMALSGTLSGAGFTSLFASPPAIGGTTAASGAFTTLSGTVTATGSTTARTLANRFADTINVLDWGAKCDGITNDTTALQNAITAGAGKARVYVPNTGTVCRTGTLAIPSNTHLTIDGTLFLIAGTDGYVLNISASQSFVTIDGGGTLDGNAANQSSAGGNFSAGIGNSLGSVSYIWISGLTITDVLNWPVNLVTTTHAWLSYLRLTNSGNSVEFAADSVDCWADHLYIAGITDIAFSFYGGCANCGISNSTAIGSNGGGITVLNDAVKPDASKNISITSNIVSGNLNGGVSINTGGGASQQQTNIVVANNVLTGNNTGEINTLNGGVFVSNAAYVSITGNTISLDGNGTLGATGIALQSNDSYVTINGNTIIDEGQGSTLGVGIAFSGANHVSAQANYIADDQGTKTMAHAFTGTLGTDNQLIGNHLIGSIGANDGTTPASDSTVAEVNAPGLPFMFSQNVAAPFFRTFGSTAGITTGFLGSGLSFGYGAGSSLGNVNLFLGPGAFTGGLAIYMNNSAGAVVNDNVPIWELSPTGGMQVPQSDQSYSYNAPTTGASIAWPMTASTLLVDPAGTIATLAVTMPGTPAPAGPTLGQVAGGALTGVTYFAVVTYVNSLGETTGVNEASLAVATNFVLTVASPAAPTQGRASGYNVYVSTTTGTETKQNATPIAIGTAWTEPTSGLITGSSLPSGSTAGPPDGTIERLACGKTVTALTLTANSGQAFRGAPTTCSATQGYEFVFRAQGAAWFMTTAVPGSGSGTVTSASVVSANGFAGTVASSTTTPAITLSTTITGALKGNGTALSQAACADLSNGATGCSTATGTSGATIGLLNGANTISGVQTYTNSDFALLGSSTGATTFTSANAGASNFTLTVPAATDTMVLLAATQTLTNKSIVGTEINSGLVGATFGGTGVNNGSNTLTLGGALTTTGAATPTLAFGGTGFTFTFPTAATTLAGLAIAETFTAPQSNSPTTLSISTATFTPNATSNIYYATLVHASCPCTIANPSTMPANAALLELWITQSATGSDTIGTWGTFYKFPGGTKPTLSTAASAIDMVSCRVTTSTTIDCVSAAGAAGAFQ